MIRKDITCRIAGPRRRAKTMWQHHYHKEKSWEGGSSESDWDVEVVCAVMTTEEEKKRDEKLDVALNVVSKSERNNYDSD
jgi:hypothetical protein